MVAAPLRGESNDGPGNHVNGAADKQAPTNNGGIPVKHRKGKTGSVFIASYFGFLHCRKWCTTFAMSRQSNLSYAALRACQVLLWCVSKEQISLLSSLVGISADASPLTPALSQGEREQHSALVVNSDDLRIPDQLAASLPLPW